MKLMSSALRTRKRKLAATTAVLMMAGTGVAVAAGEVGVADHSDQFDPVTPCRIVDTRNGLGGKLGKFANGETHNYSGISTGVCGLSTNTNTSTLIVSVTATQPDSAGFVRVFGNGDAEPQATFLNYPNASTGGFGAIGPVRIATNGNTIANPGSGQFNVKNYGGPTHIIVDVFGGFGN